MPPRHCRLLFFTVMVGLHGLLAWRPGIMADFGVSKLGPWFRDTYAMLAASDSARAGFDPFIENPYDLIGERYIYSDWWYALGKMGLERADHVWVGGVIVLLFWAAVMWVLPLTNLRQTFLSLAVCASPPFWLAVNRGNPDLLMFALLTVAVGLVLRGGIWGGRFALLPISLATGLKYFPALGGIVLLWPGATRRELRGRVILMLMALAWVAWSLREAIANYLSVGWMARGQMTFGAAALPMKVGGEATACAQLGLLVGLALTGWAAWRTTSEYPRIDRQDKALLCFVLGAVLIAGNFFMTVGYLYKIIFAVWLLPTFLVWAEGNSPHRGFARCWLGALVLLVWLMPLTCVLSPLWLSWWGEALEVPIRRGVAAFADALGWVVVVPVWWRVIPLLSEMFCQLWRREAR